MQGADKAWPDSACFPIAHVPGFAKHADHGCLHSARSCSLVGCPASPAG